MMDFKKLIEKSKFVLKNNYAFLIVLGLAIVLYIMALKELGFSYSIVSDDIGYIKSGIHFFETGEIIMHGYISAQIMPGLTFFIAMFCLFFGTGTKLIIALKISYMIMGLLSILILYKIIKLYANQIIAGLVSLLLLAPDFIWMNNIILTETPFMLLFLLLIYHSLKYIKNYNNKDFIFIIIYYILTLFLRPSICVYPLFLIIVLLIKGHDLKNLLIKSLILCGFLICCLAPWTYRNYKIFGEFIPLSYGAGSPLLKGTYQGVGYPSDQELDYSKIDDNLSEEMKYYLSPDVPRSHWTIHYSLKYEGLKAKYRMKEWWNKDKFSMLKSYLVLKPKIMIYNSFYWKDIFGISINFNLFLRKIDITLFLISIIIIIFNRKYIWELVLILLTYSYHILLYSFSFAFSRYSITLIFLRFIVIGLGLNIFWKRLKLKEN